MNKLYNKTLHVFKNVTREEDKEILTTLAGGFYDVQNIPIMKIMVITFYLWGFFIPFAFSQHGEHVGGGNFLKRVEFNNLRGSYNLNSKGDVEKLFFGDFNAQVEFFYAPSFEGASGFRIVRDSRNKSCSLEFKHIPNYKKVDRELSEKYSGMWDKQNEEKLKLFEVKTQSFPVSDQFAEKLHKKTSSLIENFKARSRDSITLDADGNVETYTVTLIMDGYEVTFRTVVDDEVWSLKIHMPTGNALKMADICRQIMTDMETKTFKESKYVELLDDIHEKK